MFYVLYNIYRVGNCETAMRLAQERLGVPIVVSPQNMASDEIDQLSGEQYVCLSVRTLIASSDQ